MENEHPESLTSSMGSSIEVLSIPKDAVEDEDLTESQDVTVFVRPREGEEVETERKCFLPTSSPRSISEDAATSTEGLESEPDTQMRFEDSKQGRINKILFHLKETALKICDKTKGSRESIEVFVREKGPGVKARLGQFENYLNEKGFTIALIAILIFYVVQFHTMAGEVHEVKQLANKLEFDNKMLDKKLQAWVKLLGNELQNANNKTEFHTMAGEVHEVKQLANKLEFDNKMLDKKLQAWVKLFGNKLQNTNNKTEFHTMAGEVHEVKQLANKLEFDNKMLDKKLQAWAKQFGNELQNANNKTEFRTMAGEVHEVKQLANKLEFDNKMLDKKLQAWAKQFGNELQNANNKTEFHTMAGEVHEVKQLANKLEFDNKMLDKKLQAWVKLFGNELQNASNKTGIDEKSVFAAGITTKRLFLGNQNLIKFKTIIESEFFDALKGEYKTPADGFYQFQVAFNGCDKIMVSIHVKKADNNNVDDMGELVSGTVKTIHLPKDTLVRLRIQNRYHKGRFELNICRFSGFLLTL